MIGATNSCSRNEISRSVSAYLEQIVFKDVIEFGIVAILVPEYPLDAGTSD